MGILQRAKAIEDRRSRTCKACDLEMIPFSGIIVG